MGTFVGHIVPGLALALLGLWHTINTIKTYCLKGNNNFTVRFWHPISVRSSLLYHLELHSILSLSFFGIFYQFLRLDSTSFFFSFELQNLEHATMFLHLAVFSGLTLFSDLSDCFDALSGVPGVLAASVFGQEIFLLAFHSADHVGVEGHYHFLLRLTVLVSFIATLVAVSFPGNFPAALLICVSVLFQGCWFINMGFNLWFPRYVPRGCVSGINGGDMHHGAVTCMSSDAEFRAKAMANLQFSWILCGIWVVVGFICLKFAAKYSPRSKSTEYKAVQSRGGDVLRAIP